MAAKDSKELATYLKGKKNVLLLTGSLCDEIDFEDGKMLIDYAADIAKKLDVPVAATANTVKGLKARGVTNAAKKLVAEMVDYMRWSPWREPIMKEKPDVLVFIGYPPEVGNRLASTVKDGETVVLGHVYADYATYSLHDSPSLRHYQEHLEELVQALGS